MNAETWNRWWMIALGVIVLVVAVVMFQSFQDDGDDRDPRDIACSALAETDAEYDYCVEQGDR